MSSGFDIIRQFEQRLAEFVGAPFAIMTDCCTHAIELCFRYDNIKNCGLTPYTYISVPMTLHKLGIEYSYINEEEQTWVGEYNFVHTRIWDSARRLERGMYKEGSMQCLSFGNGKPLQIGRGGAILLDDKKAYDAILCQRYDGRDLTIVPWESQVEFKVGYHYKPTIEEAEKGIKMLEYVKIANPAPQFVRYPDLRKIKIID